MSLTQASQTLIILITVLSLKSSFVVVGVLLSAYQKPCHKVCVLSVMTPILALSCKGSNEASNAENPGPPIAMWVVRVRHNTCCNRSLSED